MPSRVTVEPGLQACPYWGNMPLPTQAVAKATASGTDQDTPTTAATSKTLVPSLQPLPKHKALPNSVETVTNTPTRLPDNKAP